MVGFVPDLQEAAKRKYIAAFSKAIDHVLQRIDYLSGRMDSGTYHDALRDAVSREFPDARKRLDHAAHWIIFADYLLEPRSRLINLCARQNPNGPGYEVERNGLCRRKTGEITREGVERHLRFIVARAEKRETLRKPEESEVGGEGQAEKAATA